MGEPAEALMVSEHSTHDLFGELERPPRTERKESPCPLHYFPG